MTRQTSRRLGAFLHLSLDGYYCDASGDMRFAHALPSDAEWNAFVAGNASQGGMLLFGRTTYEMMAAWWPTPMAAKAMPEVAAGMNAAPKVVFSRTLATAEWANTTVVHDLVGWARAEKRNAGPDMTVLGSGRIVTQLVEDGLLDSLQVVVNPVALGAGRALFGGLARPIAFSLTQSRVFGNGAAVLCYSPRDR